MLLLKVAKPKYFCLVILKNDLGVFIFPIQTYTELPWAVGFTQTDCAQQCDSRQSTSVTWHAGAEQDKSIHLSDSLLIANKDST